jgi:hypothetical protein
MIDIIAFRDHEEQGLITARPHPTEDLIIWNYTPQCQFTHAWDDVTRQARGLITRSDGTIVARTFPKFFNYEEHQDPLPLEPFKVTEKMDGSLGIQFFEHDRAAIATRGSFVSDQAIKATQILREKYADFRFDSAYTYLFEIVYPTNRIVVDYGKLEDLILLAVIETKSGRELNIHAQEWPFPVVKHYDGISDIAALRKLEEANREGFVIRFESGLRIKLKFAEYVRLHTILTHINARVIWEYLKDGTSFDQLLERVPDEFYTWVSNTRNDLLAQFAEIEQQCQRVQAQVHGLSMRKEQAAIVVKEKYAAVIFRMLDKKSYSEAIWKYLRPQAERPFREEEA